jgi:phage terminase small subunit
MNAETPQSLPVIRLTTRQEAFCQVMACGVGGADAARRAGYSAKRAKQRGAFLMQQPEIRVRIDQLRDTRGTTHRSRLDRAAGLVEAIIAKAVETSPGLALRAIEFQLKLEGVIQDKRILHHYCLDRNHPDADLEHLDLDPEEELDPFRFDLPAPVATAQLPAPQPAPQASQLPAPKLQTPKHRLPKIVTRNSDPWEPRPQGQPVGSLLESVASIALTAPVPPRSLPAVASAA